MCKEYEQALDILDFEELNPISKVFDAPTLFTDNQAVSNFNPSGRNVIFLIFHNNTTRKIINN